MKLYHVLLAAGLAVTPSAALAQTADPEAIVAAEIDVLEAEEELTRAEETLAEAEQIDPLAPRDAAELSLDDFLWVARPIIIFADTPADPRVGEQLQLLAERPDALLERDVVIIVDTDPAARSHVRTQLRPRGFSIVVLARDGTVGLRRPALRDVREIVRAIDNFQLRQEELRRGE